MPLQICILGIDGSGKTTIASALPMILAAELGLSAASVGEEFRVCAPDEDHLAPHFEPNGLPPAAPLSRHLRGLAKGFVNRRRIYPLFKLAQMAFQDATALRLGQRHGVACVVSDGNTVLSTTGRAANYLRPASDGGGALEGEDVCAAVNNVFCGDPLPAPIQAKLGGIGKARALYRLLTRAGFPRAWLPDQVIFLDISPQEALRRIAVRGRPADRHENEADLAQARAMYLAALQSFRRHAGQDAVSVIDAEGRSPGEVLRAVFEALRPCLMAGRGCGATPAMPLGTTAVKLSGASVWARALNPRYLLGHFFPNFFHGAWREPLFPLSRPGRLFLAEGYSSEVMRVIYEQDETRPDRLARSFLGYPLHRAVYDRLQILTGRMEAELEERVRGGEPFTVFTAPSGCGYDLFRPLEKIARKRGGPPPGICLVAADLDPRNTLGPELCGRAERLGVRCDFLRGDLTGEEFRTRCAAHAPFDLALFVGISSWLSKPNTLRHLLWLRQHLRPGGLLVTDCFTPEAYALSGRYVGYKAHYYTPDSYRMLLDYCDFDGRGAEVFSGRGRINHVFLARPRRGEA